MQIEILLFKFIFNTLNFACKSKNKVLEKVENLQKFTKRKSQVKRKRPITGNASCKHHMTMKQIYEALVMMFIHINI